MSTDDVAGNPPVEPEKHRHSLFEDALALIMGTAMVALGLVFFTTAQLGSGGIAGVALLLQYATGLGFGPIFFVVNLPFYVLAVIRLGWPLTVRTVIAVGLISLLAQMTPEWIGIAHLQPFYAAVAGGGLIGVGLLILFRHRTTLGGVNILALYLQDTRGIRAGWFQLGVDCAILAVSFLVLPWQNVILSLLGATVINLTLAINHRPGRYMGMS